MNCSAAVKNPTSVSMRLTRAVDGVQTPSWSSRRWATEPAHRLARTHTHACVTSTGARRLSAVDHRWSQKLPLLLLQFHPTTHVVHQSMVAISVQAFYLQIGARAVRPATSPASSPFCTSGNAGGLSAYPGGVIFGPLSTKDIQLTSRG